MGMQINNNLAANNTYRNLSNTQTDLGKSLEKLSSGLRINRASDDAAGLALSEGLRSQIGGLTVASRNAQDGIAAVQTAEGGLNQAQAILQRLRDLGVQAANDTNNTQSRAAITTESDSLVEELGRIGTSTNFNGIKLLNGDKGTADPLKFQVGADGTTDSQITVDLESANVSKIANALKGQDATGAPLAGANSHTGAKFDLTAADTYTVTQANTGATFNFTLAANDTSDQALAKMQAAAGSTYTVSGNNTDGFKFVSNATGGATNTISLTAGTPANITTAGGTTTETAPTGLDFTSATKAQESIELLTGQITSVSTARAEIGASQNRLESAVKTISTAKENLTAAESRIRDTDMAEEMVKFTRNNILSQAGTAMLAQANQSNQGVLQLLR